MTGAPPHVVSAASAATVGGARVHVVLGLEPIWRTARVVGPAYTVESASGDNLALHHALALAPRKSVIVATLAGGRPAGHWGELMCIAAQAAGIEGLVIDGTVRDLVETEARAFPVFHSGSCPTPAAKHEAGRLGAPINIRGAYVETGDLVVADADGVVIVPASRTDEVMRGIADLERREVMLAEALAAGRTTIDELGLPGAPESIAASS